MRSTGSLFKLSLALTGTFIASETSKAGAAISLSYAAGSTTYMTTAAGESVSVPVFLVETDTAGSASLLASEDGLFGAGLDINRAVGNAAISGLMTNAAFAGLPQSSVGAAATSFTESVSLTAADGVPAAPVSAGISEVLLGTLQITSGTVATTFMLTPYVNGNGSTGGNTVTFDDFYDLDANSTSPVYTAAAPTSFLVSVAPLAVPEPASFGVLGIAAAGIFRRRR
jgi:hypothetical protein